MFRVPPKRCGAALAGAALVLAGGLHLAAAEDPPTPTPEDDPHEGHVTDEVLSFGIDEVVVTASPLGRTATDIAQGVSVLDGTQLLLKQQPTIGETLKYLPGVSSTYYGPGSSRPVIRGLSGPRLRVLENGLDTLDVSTASDDHAVTIDPLLLERIEVLRGPATLRYGPNALGGVVNAIDDRVPNALKERVLSGRVETRGASVNDSFSGGAVLEGSAERIAYRFTGFGLTSGDLSIPGFARSPQLRAADPLPPGQEARGTLTNSAVETNGFSSGLSYVGDNFYVGGAPSLFRSNYGVVVADDVTIGLSSNRLDLAGALYDPVPWLLSIDGKVRLVDYRHTEFEGAEVGTRFDSQGYDLRLEAVHADLGPVEGAVGFQSVRRDVSAEGAEAFVPPTLSNTQSGFVLEDLVLEPLSVHLGGRVDYTTVDSSGGDAFGPPTDRDFFNGSTALGLVYQLTHDQSLSFNAAYTSRPPNSEELFANGPHIALDRFEIGNPDFGSERSMGLNAAYLKTEGRWVWSVNGFYNRFWDFITLIPTGRIEDDLPVEVFTALPAQFAGTETELAYHLIDDPAQRLHLVGRMDYVWSENTDTGDPLPRIPPLRFGGSILYEWHDLHSQLDVLRAQAQDRVPANTFTTDGYTMVDLSFSYTFEPVASMTPMLFLRMSNLADQDARDAASFLKDIAPLPGRNFAGGLRVTF
jgi:iron complex outermembrane receptor protein